MAEATCKLRGVILVVGVFLATFLKQGAAVGSDGLFDVMAGVQRLVDGTTDFDKVKAQFDLLARRLDSTSDNAQCYSGAGSAVIARTDPTSKFPGVSCISYCYLCTSTDTSCTVGDYTSVFTTVSNTTLSIMQTQASASSIGLVGLKSCTTNLCNTVASATACPAPAPAPAPTPITKSWYVMRYYKDASCETEQYVMASVLGVCEPAAVALNTGFVLTSEYSDVGYVVQTVVPSSNGN